MDVLKLKIINIDEDKTNDIYASNDCQQTINAMNDFYPKIGFNPPWVGYFVFKNNQAVGAAGFTGKPQNGTVEIAYGTFKDFERQGIASFACQELIAIAKRENPNIIITAKTAPEHNSSTKILQKNGFEFIEIVQDDEIGDAWLWMIKK